MVYYRRAKLAFDAFPSFISKAVTRAQPISQFRNHSTTLVSNKPKLIPGFSSPYSILSHKPNGLRKLNPFVGSDVRFYHAGLLGFLIIATNIVGIAGLGLVAAYHLRFSEKVPYTNRRRLMLVTPKVEMKLGKISVEQLKREYEGRILCARDPKSLKVRMIFKRIIDAMKRDLSSDMPPHLVHMNWENFVLDERSARSRTAAYYTFGGKIVVYTWLLKKCTTDIELATIIAHEVGHGVARHSLESLSKKMLVFNAFKSLLPDRPRLPFIQWKEYEADHIGLMLLASAGYDPSAVPLVYEKWAIICKRENLVPYTSFEKRGEMLARTNIMEEALRRYQTVGAEVTD